MKGKGDMCTSRVDRRKVKWGYAAHVLKDPPASANELAGRLEQSEDPPRPNDVIVAEVLTIGRHTRIELASGRRATLFPGDLVGVG